MKCQMHKTWRVQCVFHRKILQQCQRNDKQIASAQFHSEYVVYDLNVKSYSIIKSSTEFSVEIVLFIISENHKNENQILNR